MLPGWQDLQEARYGVLPGWQDLQEASNAVLSGWQDLQEASNAVLPGWQDLQEARNAKLFKPEAEARLQRPPLTTPSLIAAFAAVARGDAPPSF